MTDSLPLAFAVQKNPPPRPTRFDTSVRLEAARSMAMGVAEWLKEDVSDELVEILLETMRMDGFEWALALKERYGFDPDASLVEILDGNPLWDAERRAAEKWVEANQIQAKFLPGSRVICVRFGPGTVTRIDLKLAQYTVRTDDRTWGPHEYGYVIPFEDCTSEEVQ